MIKDNKQRLFEMMNRVGGMPLIKEVTDKPTLPTWAQSNVNDFIPMEEYEKQVPCSTGIQEVEGERELNPKSKEVEDPMTWLRDKDKAIANKTKQDVEHGGRLATLMMANARKGEFHVGGYNTKKISPEERAKLKLSPDTNFEELDYDLDELRNILTTVPSAAQILGQNSKMEKSNFYNITLPAYTGIYYDISKEKFYIINVCDKAETCTKVCFAQMGNFIKNDTTVRLNAQKLNYLLNYADSWKRRIVGAISALYDGLTPTIVRWHDSGDFFSKEYMELAFEVANDTKNEAEHYAYTKEVGMAKGLSAQIPSNFEFKFSYGGKENHLIKPEVDGYAVIVPTPIFADLQPDEEKINPKTKNKYIGKGWNFPEETIPELKQRIVDFAKKEYNVDMDINSLKMVSELNKIRYDKTNARTINVLMKSGDSDVPALRRDVKGIYMLQHA